MRQVIKRPRLTALDYYIEVQVKGWDWERIDTSERCRLDIDSPTLASKHDEQTNKKVGHQPCSHLFAVAAVVVSSADPPGGREGVRGREVLPRTAVRAIHVVPEALQPRQPSSAVRASVLWKVTERNVQRAHIRSIQTTLALSYNSANRQSPLSHDIVVEVSNLSGWGGIKIHTINIKTVERGRVSLVRCR